MMLGFVLRKQKVVLTTDAPLVAGNSYTLTVQNVTLAGGQPMTLKEIGQRMGISRERVRQIECQAKSRLQKIFARRRMVKAPSRRPFPASRVSKRVRSDY